MIAVVIFGIFLALSYFLFQDQMKSVLASVVDGVEDVMGVKIGKTLDGTMDISGTGGPVVLAPNAESDFTFTNSSGTITAYTGTKKDVVIPDKINGIPVKIIGEKAFYVKSLTSVSIPSSVTSIGVSSFSGNKLTSVTIPNSVTSLGMFAFLGNDLNSLTLSESLKYLYNGAFYGNELTTLVLPKSLLTIDVDVFTGNPLTSASVPTSTVIKSTSFPATTVITRY